MGFQDILAIVIVVAATLYITRSLWRTLGGKGGGCHCSQSKSSSGSNNSNSTNPMGIKITPFVPLEQVGLANKGETHSKNKAD